MSCELYQGLLHLNRPDELSSSEVDELRAHLKTCERCAREVERIEHADAFLARLRTYSPAPADPERLTADILRRVRGELTPPHPSGALDRLFDFFLIPAVRFVSVTIILFIVATLGFQSLNLFRGISNLEHDMASSSGRSPKTLYVARSETLEKAASAGIIGPIIHSGTLSFNNGRFQVAAEDAEMIVSSASFKGLPAILGSSILGIDRKTVDKISDEIRATVQLSPRTK
jgi:anti-sigma factor RsiW